MRSGRHGGRPPEATVPLCAYCWHQQVDPFLSMIDGIGLASSEKGNENHKFKKAFDLAAKKGLQCVAHAGTGAVASQ